MEASRLASEKSVGLPESAGNYFPSHNQDSFASGALRQMRKVRTLGFTAEEQRGGDFKTPAKVEG